MALNSPTGMASAGGVGIVFDSQGIAVAPQRPYTILDTWERSFRRGWSSLAELNASLQMAPPAEGLPADAPSPNTVYSEGGLIFRYIIDPDVARQPFVQRHDDGTEEVRELLQFRKQFVALTLDGARAATDRRDPSKGEPETDFWCGFCWIRGGYSPERWAPTEVKAESTRSGGPQLVFDQPASPTDAARIRHEVAHMDRVRPTLPIESAQRPKRGRVARAAASPVLDDDTADDSGSSAED